MTKPFVVDLRAFGKHVVVKVQARDKEHAQEIAFARFGVSVTSKPASFA